MMSRKDVIRLAVATLIYSIIAGLISIFLLNRVIIIYSFLLRECTTHIIDLFVKAGILVMSICWLLGFIFSLIGSIKLFLNKTKNLALSFFGIWNFIVCSIIGFLVKFIHTWKSKVFIGDDIIYYFAIAIIIVPGIFIIKSLRKI